MNYRDIVAKNRSYRRFIQSHQIDKDILKELISLAIETPSANNKQPIKYYLSNEGEKNNEIFAITHWAGYLKDWSGPEEGERPAAYIVMCMDTDISSTADIDIGISAQTIMLGAVLKGLGGCMLSAFNKEHAKTILNLSDNLQPCLILALGKPAEQVIITNIENNSIEYYRKDNIHYVPKRNIDEIIINK